jgi:hypothetical protein
LTVDGLEHMARTKTGKTGPLAAVGWMAGLAVVVVGGGAVAASFLAPGMALAAAFPSGTTGAHAWIVDGGPEVATNMSWRVEIMLEYIVVGLAALFVALRFGRALLVRLQDWYEGEPMRRPAPLIQQVPAVMMPRPGHGRPQGIPANDRSRELHAA